jgi:hypothetical protein
MLIVVKVVVGVVWVLVICEGLVLVGCLLRGDAIVYWSVVAWGCDGIIGLPSCVVDWFWRDRGLPAMILETLFLLRSKRIVWLCALFLDRRSGSKASLGVSEAIYFGGYFCFLPDCWGFGFCYCLCLCGGVLSIVLTLIGSS